MRPDTINKELGKQHYPQEKKHLELVKFPITAIPVKQCANLQQKIYSSRNKQSKPLTGAYATHEKPLSTAFKKNSLIQHSIGQRQMYANKSLVSQSNIIQQYQSTLSNLSPKQSKNDLTILSHKRPLSKHISQWTQSENVQNSTSLQRLERRTKLTTSKRIIQHIIHANLTHQLQVQKEEIKQIIMTSNQMLQPHSNKKFDFVINDVKKHGYQAVKAPPFAYQVGKISLQGCKNPLKIEFEKESLKLQIMIAFDDETFSKNSHTYHDTTKISTQLFPYHTTCYMKFMYESSDLGAQTIRFKVYSGNAFKKRKNSDSSQISTKSLQDANNKASGFYSNNEQFRHKLTQIMNDEFQQSEILQNMEQIVREKREKVFADKNFIVNNVEKAHMWPDIHAFNQNVHVTKLNLDQHYALRKRLMSERQLRRHRISDANRWETFRQKRDELNQRKKELFLKMMRKCGLQGILQVRTMMLELKKKFEARKIQRNFDIKVIGYTKQMRWKYLAYIKKKGTSLPFRMTNSIRQQDYSEFQLFSSLTAFSTAIVPVQEHKAREVVFAFLKSNQEINIAFLKFKRFYNQSIFNFVSFPIVLHIQKLWNKQCIIKRQRLGELTHMFETEKEKLLVFLIKNKQHHIPGLVKKLKHIPDAARNALIKRYFLKCRIAHCDKFFEWRQNYLRLALEQRIMIDAQLRDAYQNNEDFRSHKVKNFREIRLPLNLGITSPDTLQSYQKLVDALYPGSLQRKNSLIQRKSLASSQSFFMTQTPSGIDDEEQNSLSFLIDNVQIMKYQPEPYIMALLVLKTTTMKEDDYEFVF